jgi:hypothetical protein
MGHRGLHGRIVRIETLTLTLRYRLAIVNGSSEKGFGITELV